MRLLLEELKLLICWLGAHEGALGNPLLVDLIQTCALLTDRPAAAPDPDAPVGAGRGPDQAERTRRTWRDSGSGETATDWSRLNVDTTLEALRVFSLV